MNDASKRQALARGVAKSKIHWGADRDEVLNLLRSDYQIEGDEADTIIDEAFAARKSAIRKKALVALAFASVGLAVSITYFAIQGFVGFAVIGFGPIFMALLAISSLAMAARCARRIVTGEAPGPV